MSIRNFSWNVARGWGKASLSGYSSEFSSIKTFSWKNRILCRLPLFCFLLVSLYMHNIINFVLQNLYLFVFFTNVFFLVEFFLKNISFFFPSGWGECFHFSLPLHFPSSFSAWGLTFNTMENFKYIVQQKTGSFFFSRIRSKTFHRHPKEKIYLSRESVNYKIILLFL